MSHGTVRHTTVYNSSRKRRPFIQTRSEEQHVQPRLRRVLLQSRGLTWLCLVVLRGHVREGHGGGAQAAQAQPNAQTHHTSRTSDHPVLHDVGRIVHAAPAHARRHAERRARRHSPPRSSPRSPRFRRAASPSSIRRRIGPLSARPCSSSPCRWAAWVS